MRKSAVAYVRPTTWAGVLLLTVVGSAGEGCSREEVSGSDSSPPNVILIVLDTLRAYHLGCYGYDRPTSPRIDAFAQEGTLYRRAFAAAPWTVPTHASLFTGKYPFEHGAHTFKVTRPVNNVNTLHKRHLTLAEAFKSAGYQTAAFAANAAYLARRWQLDQGFDTYEVEQVYSPEINRRVFQWLNDHGAARFFLFINYMDVHWPLNLTPRRGFLEHVPSKHDGGALRNALERRILPAQEPVPTDLIQKKIDRYDLALANLDEQIGRLLDYLVQKGLYDDVLIVLTSDHGEYFGEHHLIGHSKDVYQAAHWVPLIIKSPGRSHALVDDTVISSTDVPHMIFSHFPPDIAARYGPLFPDAPGNHLVIG